MDRLSDLTALARQLMEQTAKKSGGVKAAKPSEDIPGDALKAANGFREAVKSGDDLESAAADVAKHAKTLIASDMPLDVKRAAMDIESSAVKMKQAVDSIYGPFAEARQAFYALALAWDLYKKQSSMGKKSSGTDIKTQSDKEIASTIEYTAKGLTASVRDFLNKAAKAQQLLRVAAKKVGLEGAELTDSDKKAIIDACFDAKNAADPLFGRTQGVNRRAVELVARARAREKFEAKAKGIEIHLAVEDDDELGGIEIL